MEKIIVMYWRYFEKDKYDLGSNIYDTGDQTLDGTHTDTMEGAK